MSQRRLTSAVTKKTAFSLIEIMVAVSLLAMIVVGLLAVFNHTQKALRMAHNQSDVFEGARAAVNFVAQDISDVAPTHNTNFVNFFASNALSIPLPSITFTQFNVLQDVFFISQENDEWRGIGYFVDAKPGGVGTLYRFSTNEFGPEAFTNNWFSHFESPVAPGDPGVHRVVDGVVHFQLQAFDEKGRLYTQPLPPAYATNALIADNTIIKPNYVTFSGPCIPTYVDLEIGILEPQTVRQFNSITAVNPGAAQSFLTEHVGKVHLFRQRIPVRNYVKLNNEP